MHVPSTTIAGPGTRSPELRRVRSWTANSVIESAAKSYAWRVPTSAFPCARRRERLERGLGGAADRTQAEVQDLHACVEAVPVPLAMGLLEALRISSADVTPSTGTASVCSCPR